MKRKRLAAMFLSFIVLLTTAGCSGGNAAAPTEDFISSTSEASSTGSAIDRLADMETGAYAGDGAAADAAAGADAARARKTPITGGQAVDMLLVQGLKYQPSLTREAIKINTSGGQIEEDRPVSYAQFLVMLSRTFGKLPVPSGGMDLMMPATVSLTEIPDWAREDLENIMSARILPEAVPLDEEITAETARLLIARVHTAIGTSRADDFYMAVNRPEIDSAVIRPGQTGEDYFRAAKRKVDEQLGSLVEQIVTGRHEAGSPEQKIADYYQTYLDHDARDKAGLQPIRKYLDAIAAAATITELADICDQIYLETGGHIFANFETGADFLNSEKKALYFNSWQLSADRSFYQEETNRKLFLEHHAKMYRLAGFDETFAAEAPSAVFEFEKALSASQMEPQDYHDPDKLYNLYTIAELQERLPQMNLNQILSLHGFETWEQVIVSDQGVAEQFGRIYTDENIELLKTLAISAMVLKFGPTLGTAFEKEAEVYYQKCYGAAGGQTDAQKALEKTKRVFSEYLGPMYAEAYFSEAARAGVEQICEEVIAVLKRRITALDWMSEETKKKAVSKLEAVTLKIGYPQRYDTAALDAAVIKGAAAGGSYYDNCNALAIAANQNMAKEQFAPVERDLFGISVYEVNAYYSPQENAICFPAGILQAPFYDVNASKETNYGAIGYVIGHELTHAFDNNGAKYDENGNVADWWTPADYQAFEVHLKEVVNAYDGYEAYPGTRLDGALTLGENVADLGGVACALEMVRQLDDPDYNAFFESAARIWFRVGSRQYLLFAQENDTHSINNARVNLTLANFPEFYETYGIDEGDYMYIPPEERVPIW